MKYNVVRIRKYIGGDTMFTEPCFLIVITKDNVEACQHYIDFDTDDPNNYIILQSFEK